MRILADENCPADLVTALRVRHHEVLWIHADAPGMSDPAIMERAHVEQRMIITFDKDFGELVFRHGHSAAAGILLLRLGHLPLSRIIDLTLAALESRTSWAGLFGVVTEQRIRIVPLSRT